MRLSPQQIEVLVQAAKRHFGETAEIWLFGSRTDDRKKGGDIDLYIETDLSEGTVGAKLDMLVDIEEMFGEQKIDILVRSRTRDPSPIHEIAKSSGTALKFEILP